MPAPGGRSAHVIVCGPFGVGLLVIEQLHLAGVEVVVVDAAPDARLERALAGWDVALVAGDPRTAAALLEAGLDRAAAVVCAEPDDLATLEVALLARDLRHDVRVVVQLRNPAVGRAVAGIGMAVLDVAALSAPSVVEACLRTGAHEIALDDERFVAARVRVSQKATLRELVGDLAPLALESPNAEIVLSPGRDSRVSPGDVVTLLGTPGELDAAHVPWSLTPPRTPRFVSARAPRDRRPGSRGLLASLVRAADRRLALVLLALLALFTTGLVVLRLGYRDSGGGMSVLDAAYFTVETIGTVGYGDFYFRDQPTWLRIFAIGLMISGALLATVFFALLTNLLVSRRIEESLGHGRVTRLSGHVVVVGLGAIGLRVVESLVAAHVDVVVVEADEDSRYLPQVRALGLPVILGDATQPGVLAAVNLPWAAAVAVMTSDDLVNLETGLAARDALGPRWDEVPVVLRLFDRQLARTVESSFGFGSVRSTAALAAPWFVGAALGLHVLGTFVVGGQLLLVARLRVAAGGGLDGLAMGELSARTRVVALRRAASPATLEHPPRRDTRFAGGDTAFLVGPYEELLLVLRRDSGFRDGRDSGFGQSRDSGFRDGRDSGFRDGRDSGFGQSRDSGFRDGRDSEG